MSSDLMQAYKKLGDRFREVALLSTTAAVLDWDEKVNLPDQGVPYRAEQLTYLAGAVHRLSTAPEIGDWLADCEAGELEDGAAANVREWRRDFNLSSKLPGALVEEITRTSSLALQAWAEARGASDFSIFKPFLEKQVELSRRKTDYWGYADTPYDALLDVYEPGARSSDIALLFADLRKTLTEILPIARETTASANPQRLDGDYPVDLQKELNRRVVESFGFDFSAGRTDIALHPFCTGLGPSDCRLTTRYNTRDFTSSLFGAIHEAGHGMYDQGLPKESFGSPIGEAVSLGIHESQSRLWENQIGRSRIFWQRWYPVAEELFPNLRSLALDEFLLLINRVEPSFIRVDADEVTYNLHIMLRFDLEKRLMEGTLAAGDVPAAWNETFEDLFKCKVPDDRRGCLQDIHWSSGGFGYFPTYTLGTLNAAQLYHAALKQAPGPGLESALAAGHYETLRIWLKENVHRHGRRYAPGELMSRATGERTNARYFADYLRAKFK